MNNKYKLLQCLDNPDSFNPETCNKLNIGINIDKISDTNFLDSDWENTVSEYRNKLKNFNQVITVHGVGFDLNPGSPDKKVVELTKFRYRQCINIAKRLNASFIIFHSQINPWIREKKVQELKINRQIDFWHELAETAGENLTLLIENVYENDCSYLLSLIQKVNSPKVRVCMDTGHALLTSGLDEWFKNLNEHIKLIHLHWNDGSYDAHQPPDENALMKFKHLYEKYSIDAFIELEYAVDDIEAEVNRIRQVLN